MPHTAVKPVQFGETAANAEAVSIWEIFLEFLIIGATSFGGVVPYLRGSLVTKRHWVDDKEFVEMLSISQSLPGLNATNMAVLVGEKLRGAVGSIAGIVGICLPGGLLMFVVGIFYHHHGEHVWITAALKGVAAAAVGLILPGRGRRRSGATAPSRLSTPSAPLRMPAPSRHARFSRPACGRHRWGRTATSRHVVSAHRRPVATRDMIAAATGRGTDHWLSQL